MEVSSEDVFHADQGITKCTGQGYFDKDLGDVIEKDGVSDRDNWESARSEIFRFKNQIPKVDWI